MMGADVVVVGGGPVGWAFALASRLGLGERARISLVDAYPASMPEPSSPLEARVYLVAEGHARWLRSHGVEIPAARSAAVHRIEVLGEDGLPNLCVDDHDAAADALGHVVEHSALTAAIAARAQALGVCQIAGRATAVDAFDRLRWVRCEDGTLLGGCLVVLAEGRDARLIERCGLAQMRHDYGQSGVVAHFRMARSEPGIARQWFLPGGEILALLPLADPGPRDPGSERSNACVSMVFSVASDRAERLVAADSAALLGEVMACSGAAVPLVEVLSSPVAFPLAMTRISDPVGERVLAVGDAAHGMHPLAGQGVNLGLADARVWHEVLSLAGRLGGDAGHALLLGRYRRRRQAPVLAMQTVVDGLWRLYNRSPAPVAALSGGAMRLVSRLPAIRQRLAGSAVQLAV